MLAQGGGKQGQAHGRLAWDVDGTLCALQRFLPGRPHEQACCSQIWGGRRPLVDGRPVLAHDRPVLARDKQVLVHDRPVLVHGKPVLVHGRPVSAHGRLVLARGRLALAQHNCRQDEQGDDHDASCEPYVDTSSCSSQACRCQRLAQG